MDYIKLYRNLLDWEWWSDINTCRLFVYMLLKANWKDSNFCGTVIPKGSFVSSLPKLSEETSLTLSEVRTAISHLKLTGELTCKSYSKYTVFTVNNYCLYQSNDMQNSSQLAGNSQSIRSLLTTIEEKKEVKNKRNNNIFVPPTVLQVAEYCAERKNNVSAEAFVDFYTANGWVQGKGKPIKDWKAAVRTWEKNEKKKPFPKASQFNQFKQNEYDFEKLENELLSN